MRGSSPRMTNLSERKLLLVPPLPKFVTDRSWLGTNFGSERGTGRLMILPPLCDLKFLHELAANGEGTSNRRHYVPVASGKGSTTFLVIGSTITTCWFT